MLWTLEESVELPTAQSSMTWALLLLFPLSLARLRVVHTGRSDAPSGKAELSLKPVSRAWGRYSSDGSLTRCGVSLC